MMYWKCTVWFTHNFVYRPNGETIFIPCQLVTSPTRQLELSSLEHYYFSSHTIVSKQLTPFYADYACLMPVSVCVCIIKQLRRWSLDIKNIQPKILVKFRTDHSMHRELPFNFLTALRPLNIRLMYNRCAKKSPKKSQPKCYSFRILYRADR